MAVAAGPEAQSQFDFHTAKSMAHDFLLFTCFRANAIGPAPGSDDPRWSSQGPLS